MTEGWERQAACRDLSPEQADAIFFPWQSIASGKGEADYSEALGFCNRCPVRAECLDVALTAERGTSRGSRYGMFGGLTPWQRWARDRDRSPLDGEQRCVWCDAPFLPRREGHVSCSRRCTWARQAQQSRRRAAALRRDRGAA